MRKLYYLKPNLQFTFTGTFTILSALEIAVFTILIFIVDHINVNRSYDVVLYIRFSIIFITILVIAGFNFWFGTRLSHRIAGPMIQIQRVLERALKGNYKSRINLRTEDYMHEIAEDINLLLEKLEQEETNIKTLDGIEPAEIKKNKI